MAGLRSPTLGGASHVLRVPSITWSLQGEVCEELEPSLAWTGRFPGAGPLNPIKEQAQLSRAGPWARVPSWLGRPSACP